MNLIYALAHEMQALSDAKITSSLVLSWEKVHLKADHKMRKDRNPIYELKSGGVPDV